MVLIPTNKIVMEGQVVPAVGMPEDVDGMVLRIMGVGVGLVVSSGVGDI